MAAGAVARWGSLVEAEASVDEVGRVGVVGERTHGEREEERRWGEYLSLTIGNGTNSLEPVGIDREWVVLRAAVKHKSVRVTASDSAVNDVAFIFTGRGLGEEQQGKRMANELVLGHECSLEVIPQCGHQGFGVGLAAERQASAGARDGVKGKGAISLRALRCMR